MKIIICLSVFFFTLRAHTQDIGTKEHFSKLGLSDLLNQIRAIKSKKDSTHANEFEFQLKPLFKYKRIWSKFDTEEYARLWNDKFTAAFSYKERKRINEKFSNVFLKKALLDITFKVDFFEFYNHLKVIESYDRFIRVGYKEETQKLIKILYLDIFKDYVRPLLDQYQSADGQALTYNLFTSNSVLVNWDQVEKRKQEFDDFLLSFYLTNWKGLTVTEIRELNRQLLADPLFKKFSILFVNYHYLFMLQFIDKEFHNLKNAT